MALTHSPSIVTSGLQAYFDAGNPKSYTGAAWKSLVDQNDEFTVADLTYNTDNLGGLAMSTGLTTFTPGTALASILPTNNFTIETIVRSDNIVYPRSRHPFYMESISHSATDIGWACGHGATTTYMELKAANGTVSAFTQVATTAVPEATPIHRTFTVSRAAGVTTNYYENGKYIGVADLSTITGSIYDGGNFVFGNEVGWRFIGNLYIFRIYAGLLTTDEITQNFEATRSRYGI